MWDLILRFTRPAQVRAAASYAADHTDTEPGSEGEPSAVAPL
jgi:hypothetical protein